MTLVGSAAATAINATHATAVMRVLEAVGRRFDLNFTWDTFDWSCQRFAKTGAMFARVRVTGTPAYAALLLPDEAIGTDQTNKYVYVVADNGMVSRRNIQLGPLVDGLRVVREGLADGDWVITKGLHRARPGQSVAPNRVALTVSSSLPAHSTPPTKVPE